MRQYDLTTKIVSGPAGGIAGTIGSAAGGMEFASAIVRGASILPVTRRGTGEIYESDLILVLKVWQDLARQNGVPSVVNYGQTIDELLISLAQQWVNLTRRGVDI